LILNRKWLGLVGLPCEFEESDFMTKKTHLVIGTLVSLPIMGSITGVVGIFD
jgi:hypothetical protein